MDELQRKDHKNIKLLRAQLTMCLEVGRCSENTGLCFIEHWDDRSKQVSRLPSTVVLRESEDRLHKPGMVPGPVWVSTGEAGTRGAQLPGTVQE